MDRISIGFAVGQSLSLRVQPEALADLTTKLTGKGGDLWYDLPTDDGTVKLRLDSIVYLQAESSATKVGFGSN